MSYIRWFRMSEALARLGHHVDIATGERPLRRWEAVDMAPNLRRVPLRRVDWDGYDVIKTEYVQGFDTLAEYGGGDHPLVIARLASVVGPRDMDGIYFYGRRRERLFRGQGRIAAAARVVSLVTQEAAAFWNDTFGDSPPTMVVPGAADAVLPAKGPDPYPDAGAKRCLFAGQIYDGSTQPEANGKIVDRLNRLGRELAERGARLYVLGPGDASRLDSRVVSHLGSVSLLDSWDYLRHADVGVLVSAGSFMHHNESTKIYHYLRAGLPMVGESGFPNDDVAIASGIGSHVTPGDSGALARALVEATYTAGERKRAVEYILDCHSWDARARLYEPLLTCQAAA